MCMFSIKYENNSHTYKTMAQVGMEHSSQLGWGLSTIIWVKYSCSPQLPTAPAGHAALNFTYLQCAEASSIPNLCPTRPQPLKMQFQKKYPIPSLGSKTSREVLPQDVLSGSCFCFIYGHLMLLWQSKNPKMNKQQSLAYLKNRPITLGSFNIQPGMWKQTKQEAKSKDPRLRMYHEAKVIFFVIL